MENMTPEEWRTVAEAVMVWYGWGRSSWPSRSDEALVKHCGVDGAVKLLPIVRELDDDFFSSDARFTAADLPEMGESHRNSFGPSIARRPCRCRGVKPRGIIGAQAVEFGIPLITDDTELANAVRAADGTVRGDER